MHPGMKEIGERFARYEVFLPEMMMASLRLNLPSIFIRGGPMLAGRLYHDNKLKIIDITTIYEAVGTAISGEMSLEELTILEEAACPGCGSCAG